MTTKNRKRTTTQRTNVEVIVDLMNFSKCGALQQAFILNAIETYARMCIEAGASKFDSEVMNGAAWIACAKEAHETIVAHLTPKAGE